MTIGQILLNIVIIIVVFLLAAWIRRKAKKPSPQIELLIYGLGIVYFGYLLIHYWNHAGNTPVNFRNGVFGFIIGAVVGHLIEKIFKLTKSMLKE